ncbi:MAG: OsmC family protein [Thermoleophilia bacterium]
MDRDALRSVQAPLKERYASEPEQALVTLTATGTLDDEIACNVQTGRALARAGLHPATGGDGSLLCSGDMLLEALVACAGVTLKAVATALEIPLRGGTITADGALDFRGTLGVDRQAPVGFSEIALRFELDAPAASEEQLAALLKLTERYCVVLRTLRGTPATTARIALA